MTFVECFQSIDWKIVGAIAVPVVPLLAWIFKKIVDIYANRICNKTFTKNKELNEKIVSCTESKELIKTKMGRKIEDLKNALTTYDDITSRIKASIENNQAVWNFHSKKEPENYYKRLKDSIPIVTIANLKGGVGKTTLAANLAAFFDENMKKRVLVLDLDYQSSLTSSLLAAASIAEDKIIGKRQAVGKILIANEEVSQLKDFSIKLSHTDANNVKRMERTELLATSWDFGNLENSLMLNWLFNDGSKKDIRYGLARFLLDPTVQEDYDIIIIDAPPRMTTGFINALCASTRLLIPANLDRLAGQAVQNLLDEMEIIRPQLFPGLKPLGVLATLTQTRPNLSPNERATLQDISEMVFRHFGAPAFVFDKVWLPKTAAIGKAAGQNIAYLEDDNVKDIFDDIGNAIEPRL